MTASIITVIAVVIGIVWLGILFVSAVRGRGGEEIAANLRPGLNDQELETRRLERWQKAAIFFSGFLAVSLPLYFLTENRRQEGFVDEFATASITRGEHLVEEFGCFACHGPLGAGGVATYVEKRSGVTVQWEAPSLNDVLYRYDEDELNFWITYGRGNTPMPAWGLPGGGPLNEAQVVDVVNYLKTIQVPQQDVVARTPDIVTTQLNRLARADAAVSAAILRQRQVVASIERAPEESPVATDLATRARAVLTGAGAGIDTDADGLSDAAESELTAISAEAVAAFTVVPAISMDPEAADAEKAEEAVSALEAASATDPIVEGPLTAIVSILESGRVDPATGLSPAAIDELTQIRAAALAAGVSFRDEVEDLASAQALLAALEEAVSAGIEGADRLVTQASDAITAGSDPDADGISTGAERVITTQAAQAATDTLPTQIKAIALDPANDHSVGGESDARTAREFVGDLESLATSLRVATESQEKLLTAERAGLEFLLQAERERAWDTDIAGVAGSMGVDEAAASRAVALFNGYCARCHTAGFSAGVAFTQEAGSGGFGPALWDGRPVVQFGPAHQDPSQDLLVLFLIRGSTAQTPYGLNGFGTGRMPAFGATLGQTDIELLAAYLRSGNLDGRE